jgi:hypothetical protein
LRVLHRGAGFLGFDAVFLCRELLLLVLEVVQLFDLDVT